MNTQPQLPSDGQLIVAARNGMVEAWNELLRRHGAAVADVAKARRRRRSKKAAQASLAALHGSIVADDVVADGQPAVRAFRARAISTLTGEHYGSSLPAGELPANDRAASDGPASDGPANDGPANDGPASDGPANDRAASDGPASDGPASDGPASDGVDTETLASDPNPVLSDDATPDSAQQERREIESITAAFSLLPELWQTALWHRAVELQPAAALAPLLGRSANETNAIVRRAEVGLFEGFLLDQVGDGGKGSDEDSQIAEDCVPVVALLGGSLRSTLSAHQQRLVDDHVNARPNGSEADPGCRACQRRLAVNDELMVLVPIAIVPGLTGLSVERYRDAVSVQPQPVGAVAIDEQRTDRARRLAFLGAFAAVLLAVVAAVVLIRDPFDGVAFPPDSAFDLPATTQPLPATTNAPDTTVAELPTTTEVELRPPPTGPEHRTELVFAQGTRAVGFASTPPSIAVELESLAPIFAGGTGTIDVTITNSGSQPVDTNFALDVPSGVVFDGLIEGVGDCVQPDDDSAFCNVTVAGGQTSMLALRFKLTSATVGRFIVETNTSPDTLEIDISAIHRLVHSSVGRGEVVMIGNTLMTCDESESACVDARDGVGEIVNRWDLPMRFVGANTSRGWKNSSAATLEVGDQPIEAAYLFWSGDLNERNVAIPSDGSNANLELIVPNASEPVAIAADRVRLGDIDATQYLGFADVTDIVREAGSGDYVVANVQSVEVQGSYAGWSLVVVAANDAMPRRELVVISPFAWFSPADTYSQLVPVPLGNGRSGTIDVLAFEGERGFVPEQLSVGQIALGNDGAFDSSLGNDRDPQFANNFGIGIDTYALNIDAPDGTLAIEATSGKDGVRLAVYGLAVDLE